MTIKLLLIALLGTLMYHHASAQIYDLPPGAGVTTQPRINQGASWYQIRNLPQWATPVLTGKPFYDEYEFSIRLNPFLVQGDFNGDGLNDIAVLIHRRRGGSLGIAILHAGASQPIILGALGASAVGSGLDFSWMDGPWMNSWSVYPKGPVPALESEGPPPQLRGDALLLYVGGSVFGLAYWDGVAYRWYKQAHPDSAAE